jgi:tRNA A37 methylthiotransferase MiaB
LACGYFVATFPKESEANFKELLDLWITHLSDNIYSVRHHSAVALSAVYKKAEMYQETLMERFKDHIKTHILKAKTDQKESSK